MKITQTILPIVTASALALLSSCATVSRAVPVSQTPAPSINSVAVAPTKSAISKKAKTQKKSIPTNIVSKKSLPAKQPSAFTKPDFLQSGAGLTTEVC